MLATLTAYIRYRWVCNLHTNYAFGRLIYGRLGVEFVTSFSLCVRCFVFVCSSNLNRLRYERHSRLHYLQHAVTYIFFFFFLLRFFHDVHLFTANTLEIVQFIRKLYALYTVNDIADVLKLFEICVGTWAHILAARKKVNRIRYIECALCCVVLCYAVLDVDVLRKTNHMTYSWKMLSIW